jgi:hypothetical protein
VVIKSEWEIGILGYPPLSPLFLSAKETFQKRQYKGYKNFSKIRVRFFIRASGRVALAVSNPFYGN